MSVAGPNIQKARRVLSTDSTNSDAFASLEGYTLTPPSGMIDCAAFRGARAIIPYGTDADGEDYTMRIYGVTRVEGAPVEGSSANPAPNYLTLLLAEVTVTIGTVTGVENGLVTDAHRFAKDLAVTKKQALSQWIEALYGLSIVDADLSTDHGLHILAIPDLGNLDGLKFDFTTNGASSAAASMNALIQFAT